MPKFLSIDVEDWFQVKNFSRYINRNAWNKYELRIINNIDLILQKLDNYSSKATFFVLGWIAEKSPELIKKIRASGHEIACHGYGHFPTYDLELKNLKIDILSSKKLLEDLTGEEVIGYRAPSFSISEKLIDTLCSLNFVYDSSLYFSTVNKDYGKLNGIKSIPQKEFKLKSNLFEFPLSSLGVIGLNVPWSGGFMFRAVPSYLFLKGMTKIYSQSAYYMFYAHPWEFDSAQPKVKSATISQKIKHYYNIDNALYKFEKILQQNKFISIKDYIGKCQKL